LFGIAAIAAAQSILSVAPPQKIAVRRGSTAEARLKASLEPGFHVNSNAPEDDYLIPLKLIWEPGPLSPLEIVYPKAEHKKYPFSAKPLAVFSDHFEILTRFRAAPDAPRGPGILNGKLRYQACTEDRCYAPKTATIRLPYTIE